MNYIETVVRYEKTLDSGAKKVVTERFVCEALSLPEAEAMAIQELKCGAGDDDILDVTATKKIDIEEVFGDKDADKFFAVKIKLYSIDDKTGQSKPNRPLQYLVGAETFNAAFDAFTTAMKDVTFDFDIVNITETQIKSIFKSNQV